VAPLLTQAAAAVRIGISLRSFQRALTEPDPPPAVRMGGAIRYHEADLDAWLDRRRAASGPASPAPDTER
jgi:predicted DNA-binding transcriptional regulator AlpA